MLKGIAVSLAVCIVALIALMVAARGMAFDVRVIAKAGQLVLGVGIGTSAVGGGLWLLARLAASYLTRRTAG
jgi:hypothetical protein